MPCVHLEGPYFAASQKGAQPEKYLRTPDPEEYGEILKKYGSLIGRWSAAKRTGRMEALLVSADGTRLWLLMRTATPMRSRQWKPTAGDSAIIRTCIPA